MSPIAPERIGQPGDKYCACRNIRRVDSEKEQQREENFSGFPKENWRELKVVPERANTPVPTRIQLNLPEGLDRGGFVVLYVKNGVQLGDLQQVVDFLCQIEQLEFATLILHGRIGADELADSRAVNVIDVAKIHQNFLLPFREQVLHHIAQDDAAFAQRNSAVAIHNGDAVNLACAGL